MTSQLSCAPGTTEAITVGQIQTFKCALDEKLAPEILASGADKVEFISPSTDGPYGLVFLGAPKIVGSVLEVPFTSYKVGTHQINGLTIKWNGVAYSTSPFSFTVTSVLPPAEEGMAQPQPYPIVEPQAIPVPIWWWAMWIFLGAVASGILGYKAWSWYKKRKATAIQKSKEVILTPAQKYNLLLQKLESKGFHFKGEYKSFALELTVIVKKTIGQKFNFPAEDLTTEEFFEELKTKKEFFSEAGSALKNLLSELDQIKFAKTETSLDKCVHLLDISKNIGTILFKGDK